MGESWYFEPTARLSHRFTDHITAMRLIEIRRIENNSRLLDVKPYISMIIIHDDWTVGPITRIDLTHTLI